MHQLRGPIFSLRGQPIALDWLSIGPAIILSIPSGWKLASDFWQLPAAGAVIGPLAICVVILSFEYIRAWLASSGPAVQTVRILTPLGSVEDGFRISSSPGSELRSELKIIAVMVTVGLVLLAPVLALSAGRVIPWLAAPGVLVVGYALVQIIPSFPMSGGYILRSVFWDLLDQHTNGTRAAFLYSQLVGAGALGFGVFFLIWHPETIIVGLWCLVIGVVALRASRAELLRSTIIERAPAVRAADAVAGLNPTIRADATLLEAIDILLEQRANGPALVRDRNVYIGMLDLNSVRKQPRNRWSRLRAADLTISFDDLVDSEPGADLLTIFRSLEDSGGIATIVRETNGQITGLVDRSMEPRLLMRRGVARTITGVSSERTSSGDSGTS